MSDGLSIMPWSGGAPLRGHYWLRSWSGGDRTPEEKSLGVYPPHPYTTWRYMVESPKIAYKETYAADYQYGYACELFGFPEQATDPWSAIHWNALIAELWSKVKGGDFNATVVLSQMSPTLRGLADSATRLYRGYKYARKGRLRDAAIALTGANKNRLSNKAGSKEMSRNWLELQYGWLPLLGDIHDSTEILANSLHRPIRLTHRVRKTVSARKDHDYWWGASTVEHRCQIIVRLNSQPLLIDKLGLTDPFSVAWESLPFSFVLDWALPIGPWLEAAAAARSMDGQFIVTHRVTHRGGNLSSGAGWLIRGGGETSEESVALNRTVDSVLATQVPPIKPFGKIASLGHCLNALALLEQLRH